MALFQAIAGVFQSSLAIQNSDPEFQGILNEIHQQYPALQKHGLVIKRGEGPGYAETYPYYESESPIPGRNVIEIRDKNLTKDQIKTLITGESLHILGGLDPETGQAVDPGFRQFKDQFLNSLTPNQLTFERMQYRNNPDMVGAEGRPFDQYFDASRADAYLRGNLFPITEGERADWSQAVTPDQSALFNQAQQYMQGK